VFRSVSGSELILSCLRRCIFTQYYCIAVMVLTDLPKVHFHESLNSDSSISNNKGSTSKTRIMNDDNNNNHDDDSFLLMFKRKNHRLYRNCATFCIFQTREINGTNSWSILRIGLHMLLFHVHIELEHFYCHLRDS